MWEANTSNMVALTGPDGLTRTAAGYCNPELLGLQLALRETQVKLTFSKAYTGNLRVYSVLVGRSAGLRRETARVDHRRW